MSEESNKIIELFCKDIVNKINDIQYKFKQLKDMGLLDDLMESGFGMVVHVRAFDERLAECVLGKGPTIQKSMLSLMLRIGALTKGDENAED